MVGDHQGRMMNELALFAGAGGGLLASKLLGWSTICAVEIEPFSRSVLLKRQAAGHLEPFPIWDDVCTFDGNPWRGSVDIVSGGFPCQNISSAGKREGITGKSSSLIFEMLRIIAEVQPQIVFAENSPELRSNGLGAIITTLAGMGYDCAWCVLGAWHAGAPHRRNRLWLVACNTNSKSKSKRTINAKMARVPQSDEGSKAWQDEPALERMVDGVANRMDQLRAIGNGQVPAVAAMAFEILMNTLRKTPNGGNNETED